jgi:glucuronosyltransferase
MPESKRNAFLEAFSKLKQHVLWKWETDTLPGQPSNVKLGKWLPQSDILGEFHCNNKPCIIGCNLDPLILIYNVMKEVTIIVVTDFIIMLFY